MVWLEFKIKETTHIEDQKRWREEGKSWNEIATIMEKRLDVRRDDQTVNHGSSNPSGFIKQIRDLIKEKTGKYLGSLAYDPDNDTYKIQLPGDIPDADDFYSEFDKSYQQITKDDEGVRAWRETHNLHHTISGHDEAFEMSELEDRSPSQGSPVVRPKEKKSE